jgi:tetratricopeptide (TPR) repeat protein
VGRLDEALVEVRRAKDLDPLTPVFIMAYGATLRQNGLYAEAIEQLERAIAIAPDIWFYYYELALAYVGLGRFSDAEEAVRRGTAALGGEDPEVLIAMIRGIADPALRESAIATVSSYPHPELRMLLGDREGALRDLERYVFDPPYGPKWIIWDAFLEPLRDDPRFAELVRRVGLTP